MIDSRRLSPLMRRTLLPVLVALVAAGAHGVAQDTPEPVPEARPTRFELDIQAMDRYRPGFPFWRHVFSTPDGAIAFGSATDGRLLAVFPSKGSWTEDATWIDPALQQVLAGQTLPNNLDDRRDRVAEILEETVGPVLHNPTRGTFVAPNVPVYGGFLVGMEPHLRAVRRSG